MSAKTVYLLYAGTASRYMDGMQVIRIFEQESLAFKMALQCMTYLSNHPMPQMIRFSGSDSPEFEKFLADMDEWIKNHPLGMDGQHYHHYEVQAMEMITGES